MQTSRVSRECISRIDDKAIIQIQKIAIEFNKSFRGLSVDLFFNWLCWNYLMLTAFQSRGVSPVCDGLIVAEIGPGLGPVTSLLSKSSPEIYSFDTFEMQKVAQFVESTVIQPRQKIQYHAMNLAQSSSVNIASQVSYCLIAFYSFTEIHPDERKKHYKLLHDAEYSIIVTNYQFEVVNNFDYLEKLAQDLNKKFSYIELQTIFGPDIPKCVKNHRIYLLQRLVDKS